MKKWTSTLEKLVSLPGVLAFALIYGLLVGLQGLHPRAFEHVQAARRVGNLLTSAKPGSSWSDALSSASPGLDLVGGLAIAILPGWHVRTLWGLGLVSMLVATALLWRLLRDRVGAASAAMASVLLVANPVTTAELMVPSGTWPTIALFLAVWVLALEKKQPWWKGTLLWVLGAIWMLSWPWMLLWCALLLWSNARRRAVEGSAGGELPGMIPPSHFSLGLLLAPLVVPALALAMHPGFWSDPKQGLLAFGAAAFLPNADGMGMAKAFYPAGRLPFVSGAWWLLQHVPIALLGLGVFGAFGEQKTPMARESLVLLALIPWMIPGGHLGAIDSTAIAMVPLSILAAPILIGVARQAWERFEPRQVFMALAAGNLVLLAPLIFSLATYFPYVGTWRGALTGGAVAAIQRGEVQPREQLLSLGALETFVKNHPDCSIYAPEDGALLEEFIRAGALPNISSPARDGATHILSRVPRQNSESPPVSFDAPSKAEKEAIMFGPGDLPLFVLRPNK